MRIRCTLRALRGRRSLRVEQIRAEGQAWAPTLTLCEWIHDWLAGKRRQAALDHRRAEHPGLLQPKRRRRDKTLVDAGAERHAEAVARREAAVRAKPQLEPESVGAAP